MSQTRSHTLRSPSAGTFRFLGSLLVTFVVFGTFSLPASARPLDPAQLVECQRAIEEVFWAERIWPRDNPGPKPRLAEIFSDAELTAKAMDGPAMTSALVELYGDPIRPQDLQAEIDRMVRESRSPEVLARLFAALGDEPYLVAECLARPSLGRRRLRAHFSRDRTVHGPLEARIRHELKSADNISDLRAVSGNLVKVTVDRTQEDPLAGKVGGAGADAGIPWPASDMELGSLGPVIEDENRFWLRSVTGISETEIDQTIVSWPKTRFESWWSEERSRFALAEGFSPTETAFRLPPLRSSSEPCEDDTWMTDAILERHGHVAVWTGAEVLVWGGDYDSQWLPLNDGFRYRPATGEILPLADGLGNRCSAKGFWTGTEMLVVGCGAVGARYDAAADTWSPMGWGPPDSARVDETVVWTGSELLMWGGRTGAGHLATGGRYDPVLDAWTPMTMVDAPAARIFHTAVWTGDEMVVWGGRTVSATGGTCDADNVITSTGGRYDPDTDSWTPTATPGAPTARSQHVAAWVEGRMVVAAGHDDPYCGVVGYDETGASYDPVADSWTANADSLLYARVFRGIATGSTMTLYSIRQSGGVWNMDLASYDPVADQWEELTIPPELDYASEITWAGSELVFTGGPITRYHPASDMWFIDQTVPIQGRKDHAQVWTGAEMLVWGGWFNGDPIGDGGRYLPATHEWTETSSVGDPSARSGPPRHLDGDGDADLGRRFLFYRPLGRRPLPAWYGLLAGDEHLGSSGRSGQRAPWVDLLSGPGSK